MDAGRFCKQRNWGRDRPNGRDHRGRNNSSAARRQQGVVERRPKGHGEGERSITLQRSKAKSRCEISWVLLKTGPSIPFCGEIFNMLAVGAERTVGEASVIASAVMRRHRIA